MVRYKSKETLEHKLKQNQLHSTRNANLRMHTVLRTRSQTIQNPNTTRVLNTF